MASSKYPTNLEDHLEAEILAAYCEDRLPEEEMEGVREHLASCPGCTEQVLALMEFTEDPQEVSPRERETSWQELRASLQQGGLVPAQAQGAKPKVVPIAARRSSPSVWRTWALAASLTAITLGAWSFSLYRQLESLRQPQVDPPLSSLMPLHELRTSEGDVPGKLVLAPGARGWLVLNFTQPTVPAKLRVAAYQLEDHNLVWQIEAKASEKRSLRLEITLEQIPPGQYQIELAGFEPGERGDPWRPFASYRLDVAAASTP